MVNKENIWQNEKEMNREHWWVSIYAHSKAIIEKHKYTHKYIYKYKEKACQSSIFVCFTHVIFPDEIK